MFWALQERGKRCRFASAPREGRCFESGKKEQDKFGVLEIRFYLCSRFESRAADFHGAAFRNKVRTSHFRSKKALGNLQLTKSAVSLHSGFRKEAWGAAKRRCFRQEIKGRPQGCLKIRPFMGRKFIDTVLLEGKHENADFE